MTNGAAAAIILSNQILKRQNPWAEVFNPNRFTPLASAKNFLLESLNNTEYLIGDRLRKVSEQSPERLASGEGKILKWKGKKIAACKDENGKLHTLSPICPHLKCIVHWNNAEKSWDCPCHGSRFDSEGKVLHGPAAAPLKTLDYQK
jgi:Rieske Fe-S protein